MSAYAVALTVVVLLMYAFRSRSELRSDQAFLKRPGSPFLLGLLTFSLAALTALLVAMLLQGRIDRVWHGRDDQFTAFSVRMRPGYSVWP